MAEKVRTSKKLRGIWLKNVGQTPPIKTVKECACFLQNQLKDYAPTGDNADILGWLEKTHMAAIPIARAITIEKERLDNKLPDSGISDAELKRLQRDSMLELIQHANAMIALINTGSLSLKITAHLETTALYVTQSNTAGRKTIEQPLTRRLNQFVKELKENLPVEEEIARTKKSGTSRGREMAIWSVVDAWHDITGKPPEKLKRDKLNETYGGFHNFLRSALMLFPYTNPGIEGAINIANDYWKYKNKQ